MVGISWNAVVGITAAYTSDRFGVGHMGMIYGTMFAVMPFGSGLGAFLGGYFYDEYGSYQMAIVINLALLVAAGLLGTGAGAPAHAERDASGGDQLALSTRCSGVYSWSGPRV